MFDKEKLYRDAIVHQKQPLPTGVIVFAVLAILFGLAAFFFGLTGDHPQRVWQIFLVNFLYFIGIAQGMVVFAAVLQMTHAKWGRPVKRVAELGACILPFSLLFMLILFLGRNHIFPWIIHPIPEKANWLNVPFLFARDTGGFLLLATLGFLFLKISVQPDRKAIGLGTLDFDQTTSRLNLLAPVITILYAVIYSLIAFDLIMSLDPHWYSTLFGAYFFMTSFYAGMAALVLVLAISRKHFDLEGYIGHQQFHDIGKLLFGFCIVSGDFFWSQFLVIWYGNLPEETRYVILRLRQPPWSTLSYVVLFIAFVIPFVLMLSRNFKRNPRTMLAISILILAGVWLEKFLLIVPSIWHQPTLPLGITEFFITLAFLGGFLILFLFALRQHPILPVSDPLLHEHLKETSTHKEAPSRLV